MKHLGKMAIAMLLATAIGVPAYATSSGGGTTNSVGANTDRSSSAGSNTDRGSNVGANTDRRSGSVNTNNTTSTNNRPGNVDIDTSGAARTDILNRGSGNTGVDVNTNTSTGTANGTTSTNTEAGLDFEGYRAFTGTNSEKRRGELQRNFRQLDKNNDSRLSDEELRAATPSGR